MSLWKCKDVARWNLVYNTHYSSCIESMGLTDLNRWIWTDLPQLVNSRVPRHFKLEELTKVMKWKLSRGKFRPNLMKLIGDNKENVVEEITTAALEDTDMKSALKTLCKLKGVGPATASLILSIMSEDCLFLADEAYLAVPGLPKLKYDMKGLLLFIHEISTRSESIELSCRRLSHCLWAEAVSQTLEKKRPQETTPMEDRSPKRSKQ